MGIESEESVQVIDLVAPLGNSNLRDESWVFKVSRFETFLRMAMATVRGIFVCCGCGFLVM